MHLVPKGVCRAVLLVQRGLQPCDSGVLGGQCLLDGGYNRVRALCHPDPRIEVVVSMRAKFDALGAKHLVQPLDHGRGHAPSAGCGGSVPVWRNASPNAASHCSLHDSPDLIVHAKNATIRFNRAISTSRSRTAAMRRRAWMIAKSVPLTVMRGPRSREPMARS